MQGVGVPGTVINRYCWIMSTFTLPKHFEGETGEDFIHHGVGEQYPWSYPHITPKSESSLSRAACFACIGPVGP